MTRASAKRIALASALKCETTVVWRVTERNGDVVTSTWFKSYKRAKSYAILLDRATISRVAQTPESKVDRVLYADDAYAIDVPL